MIGRKDPVVKVKDIPKSKYTSADMMARMQHHRGMPATIEEYLKQKSFNATPLYTMNVLKVVPLDDVLKALEYYYGDDGK